MVHMVKEILKARCIYCGKEVFSLYKKQLDYNVKAHEISCPERKEEESKLDDAKGEE